MKLEEKPIGIYLFIKTFSFSTISTELIELLIYKKQVDW